MWVQISNLVVITKKLVEEVYGFVTDESLIVRIYELFPRLLRIPAQNIVVLSVEFDVVFIEVIEEIIRAQYFGDFHQLV